LSGTLGARIDAECFLDFPRQAGARIDASRHDLPGSIGF